MYNYSYPARKSNRFSYADGYCSVFPRGIEKRFKSGKGHIVLEDEYIVVIKDDTPEDIERRFLKEYAEFYSKTQKNNIYLDD